MKKAVQKTTKKTTGEKYVTETVFERSMMAIAKSFIHVDERFNKIDERFDRMDKAFEILIKGFQTFQQEAHDHRLAMSALTHSDVKHERKIDELFERVEKLEAKVK